MPESRCEAPSVWWEREGEALAIHPPSRVGKGAGGWADQRSLLDATRATRLQPIGLRARRRLGEAEALLSHRHPPARPVAEDEVVEHGHFEERTGLDGFAREADVVGTRRGVAARMVVRERDLARVQTHRLAEQLGDARAGGADGAAIEHGRREHVVLGVEDQQPQLFLLEQLHLRVQQARDVLRARDQSGAYRLADEGKISQMPGVSAAFEEPTNPDLLLHTDQISVEESVSQIVDLMKAKGFIA